MKKLLTFLVCLLLTFALTTSNIFAFSGGSDEPGVSGGTSGDEDYYRAVSQMVQSYWSDDYFSQATLNIQDSTLEIDNRLIQLDEAILVEQDELMLSEEVLNVLGVQVQKNDDGVSVSKNGKTVELTYGEHRMIVNGDEEGLDNAPVVENGAPLIPESALTEEGLGFEITRAAEHIVITNEFQTMRVIAKIRTGAALPAYIQTEQTIAGPDNLYILQFGTVDEAKTACEMLNESTNVIYAEPDGIIATAGALSMAETIPLTDDNHLGWGARRIDAKTYMDYLIENGKQNAAVTVGILDTGLDMEHPFFAGRYVEGYNFVAPNYSPSDDHMHGTHVSSIVIDVTIDMPNVKVMPLKVLDYLGTGSALNIANGILWAADNGVDILNASINGVHYAIIEDAIAYAISKNITVSVAAGNNASDTRFTCPAHIEEVITVSAINRLDNISASSNYGAAVDVAAPGQEIPGARRGGGIITMSGTSMAASHASGAAALLLCNDPSQTPAEIKSIIRECADKVTPGFDLYYGYGILNIGNAVPEASCIPDFTITPGNGQITLSWTLPSNNYDNAVIGIQASIDNVSTWVNVPSSGYTFTGLTNGATYILKIRMIHSKGAGDEISIPVTLDPVFPESTHPYANNLTIISPGNLQTYTHPSAASSLRVTFSSETKVESGYDKIYVTDANGVNITGSPFTGTTLAGKTVIVPGNTVKIYITSDSSINYYGYKVMDVEATTATVPSEPLNFAATPGNGQVMLSWTAPASDGGSAITGYQVTSDNGSTWINASSNTGHTFSGLTYDITYIFQVRARNAVGAGAEATLTATTPQPIYPETMHPYANNLTIISPGNLQTYTHPGVATSLKVTFSSDTKVENSYDKIYVTDANGTNIPGSPFTGTTLAGTTVTVPGNTVKIYITSDSSINYYGYRVANIEAVTE